MSGARKQKLEQARPGHHHPTQPLSYDVGITDPNSPPGGHLSSFASNRVTCANRRGVVSTSAATVLGPTHTPKVQSVCSPHYTH